MNSAIIKPQLKLSLPNDMIPYIDELLNEMPILFHKPLDVMKFALQSLYTQYQNGELKIPAKQFTLSKHGENIVQESRKSGFTKIPNGQSAKTFLEDIITNPNF